MGIIHHVQSYFQKATVRIRLYTHIRTIAVLTGGKLIRFYFLYLLSAIYFSVTMHRQKGNKVNILKPGDVNPRPDPSRRCMSIVRRVTTAHLGRVET
jgi:hypothetical protein